MTNKPSTNIARRDKCEEHDMRPSTNELLTTTQRLVDKVEGGEKAPISAEQFYDETYQEDNGCELWPVFKEACKFAEAYARALEAERCQTINEVKYRERLKKLSFLITGNDYALLAENPQIEESLKCYLDSL